MAEWWYPTPHRDAWQHLRTKPATHDSRSPGAAHLCADRVGKPVIAKMLAAIQFDRSLGASHFICVDSELAVGSNQREGLWLRGRAAPTTSPTVQFCRQTVWRILSQRSPRCLLLVEEPQNKGSAATHSGAGMLKCGRTAKILAPRFSEGA
jgi:hypothetical protein